ncbi:MAG: efflux RND transporter periplasmic adaptor subunit [Candidatus Brocadiia bacterium]
MRYITAAVLLAVGGLTALAASAPAEPTPGESEFCQTLWPTTTMPHTRATLSSKLDEVVADVLVEEGEAVRAGQVLVRFDDGLIQARIATAEVEADFEARIEAARTRHEWLKREYERNQSLEPGVDISESELDEARFKMDSARLDVAELERSEELAEKQLQYYRVRAEDYVVRSPIDGVVSRTWIEPGEMAQVGEPLVEVMDPHVIEARVRLDESCVPRVATGQQAAVVFPATGEQTYGGRVNVVSPYVDSSSGLFVVKVLVEPGTETVKPGMECRVRFQPVQD